MTQQDHADHDSHGQSVAAWVTVLVLIIAATVISAGIVANSPLTWGIGIGLIIVGLVVGRLLTLAGYGSAPAEPRTPVEL